MPESTPQPLKARAHAELPSVGPADRRLPAYSGGAGCGGTKWFVRDFVEVLRVESAQEGPNIRTATIYPAAIHTELLGTIEDKTTADSIRDIFKQDGISPDRIANVVAFAIDQPHDTTISEFMVGRPNQPEGTTEREKPDSYGGMGVKAGGHGFG